MEWISRIEIHAYRVLEKSRSTYLSLDGGCGKEIRQRSPQFDSYRWEDPLSSDEEKRQRLKKGKSFDFLEEREIRTRSFHGYIGRWPLPLSNGILLPRGIRPSALLRLPLRMEKRKFAFSFPLNNLVYYLE